RAATTCRRIRILRHRGLLSAWPLGHAADAGSCFQRYVNVSESLRLRPPTVPLTRIFSLLDLCDVSIARSTLREQPGVSGSKLVTTVLFNRNGRRTARSGAAP